MIKKHFVIKWEGYPVMSLSSMEDAQEMILAIAQENVYYDFYQAVQLNTMSFQEYVDYIEFCRESQNYRWDDAGIVGFETWYGYALLESAESYSIGEIIHLD